jgi:hypothetical protein
MASNGKIKAKRLKKQLAKKPAALPPRPPAICRLDVTTNCCGGSSRESSNDGWDRGDTYTQWTVNGLRLTNREYGDVTADFEVQAGDTVYLVYAIYSTGDSFGHDTNANIEFITVHKDRAIAEANERALNGKTTYLVKGGNYDWNVNLQTDTGIVFPYHVPWLGYFESLTGVYVESFTVQPTKA